MIILEREQSYVMVTQNDHAKIAGKIAQNCKKDYFFELERTPEVLLAIKEHDRGWIELDTSPVWNDKTDKPYSFIDYPTELKIPFYKKGLDEVEKMSKYAGLLCSLHYSSLLHDATQSVVKEFWNEEKQRKKRLSKELGLKENADKNETLMYQLDLLKFSDYLSLYISLNEPGDNKRNHPFFQNGFPQLFLFVTDKPIVAHWENPETVSLSFSPLKNELEVQLPYKEVLKDQIDKKGILEAYKDTPLSIRKVTFK
ncbi:DUF3891 family protein [Psychrobacillus sp. FJAT-21963]|uniref:DUF3891 family protein n=1 Tax=Psychrobacillus sp. FJAT-21963 TaxID=1712028 RepID=UPI0006F27D12|nr:DUF3891 family protein [Psychrobacillus sp. FJAT-21963]KQL34332.1 hypothetical protein AN959_15120 [Psychrobacillus sp. FJAT-21963]